MLGSMYSAVSGLSAHQKKMDVIGNNIANVNTYGFKSSRVSFTDVFYQTLNGALAPKDNAGGKNPTQLGYGVQVGSIDVINTRAGSATTDRALDVYINGDGYIPVKDSNGVVKYTRVGILNFDTEGNLVDSNGNMVLGLRLDGDSKLPQMDADGTTSIQELEPIKVAVEDLEKYTGISIGQNGEITAIREGDPAVVKAPNTGWLTEVTLPPTSVYSGEITITEIEAGEKVNFVQGKYLDGAPLNENGSYTTVENDADIMGPLNISYDGTNVILNYTKKDGTADTRSVSWDGTTTTDLTFAVDDTGSPVGTAEVKISVAADRSNGIVVPNSPSTLNIGNVIPDSMTLTLSTFDKAGAAISVTGSIDMSGNPPADTLIIGDLSMTVDPARFGTRDLSTLKGSVMGTAGPGPGVPEKIANMGIVDFINPDGLSQSGEGYYIESTNSGSPVAKIPGGQGTGNLRSGALEMSNVDLSREFTEMIIAQRGFQANTRMITVSDEMLSELVNMKR